MSEERVEYALRHLGEDLRYDNPTQAALRQARRMRVRRNVVGGTGAALAMVAVIAPFAYGSGEKPAPPVASPTAPATGSPTPVATTPPATKPAPRGAVALPGGVYVASASSESGSHVYDPKTHKYRSSGYPRAWASPNGRLAAVADDDGRVGILDVRRDDVRWIAGARLEIGRPQWSRDGRRLAFAGPGADQPSLSIVVVDVATAKARTLQPAVPCVELCQPTWLPGDLEIGLPDASHPIEGLTAYPAEGGRGQWMPFGGAVQSSDAWSPDGRYVVAEIANEQGFAGIGIVDVATTAVLAELDCEPGDGIQARGVIWATPDRIVAVAERELIVFSTDGKEVQRIALPPALRGVENALAFARP
ncbi:hypothetical protein Ais01nite_64350 [Asanoa ishikariensis]|uniref:WD40-like Beta Propeller Repeat n=1 Tax=Asanoa ishikariensis TaxID=137265 RepID=A0A1H3NS28_9ACTN|nr:hypothetical protein [Asanoa ishikariensis]GIF68400.1 hypothetical protein Ais01nite_64350 [Asanoa ishikariensis]SDY91731.1 hypothetical protein SAMN05421684_2288 [Asanoa ishikariensis]